MLKKLFLVFVSLLVIAAGGLFFFWRQAAQLPDWYDPESAEGAMPPTSVTAPDAVPSTSITGPDAVPSTSAAAAPHENMEHAGRPDTVRPNAVPNGVPPASVSRSGQPNSGESVPIRTGNDGTRRLNEQELNTLLERALESRPKGRRAKAATKAIRASIEGDRLAVGAVTNLDRLSAVAENDEERAAIRKLKSVAPWIDDKDFYLGVKGQPRARDGELSFDDVTLEVGKLSFDPEQLLQLLGMPSDRLDRELSVRLPDAELQDIRIEGDELLLSLHGIR